eukprot:TRINITY_DN87831_c0_g1_i1.p1 TRINITY_DN87831_c0_g1~~TRINITY_DN87831_c0_g1_i1.p1  ORF type:complete len:1334 (+),score=184.72 TRINITY_DN87831_c0_g1_i1:213-4214(+)
MQDSLYAGIAKHSRSKMRAQRNQGDGEETSRGEETHRSQEKQNAAKEFKQKLLQQLNSNLSTSTADCNAQRSSDGWVAICARLLGRTNLKYDQVEAGEMQESPGAVAEGQTPEHNSSDGDKLNGQSGIKGRTRKTRISRNHLLTSKIARAHLNRGHISKEAFHGFVAAKPKKSAMTKKTHVRSGVSTGSDIDCIDADKELNSPAKIAKFAGQLPKRLGGCSFDPSTQDWVSRRCMSSVPRERHSALLSRYSHQIEKATNDDVCCRVCGDHIVKERFRVGYPRKDEGAKYGAVITWFHIHCARQDTTLTGYAKIGDTRLRRSVLGYEFLPHEEMKQFRDELLRGPVADLMADPTAFPAESSVQRLPQHQAPTALKVPMLPFQAEGLGWMLAREADETTKGGILADEMGMGKTLQTISLMLAGELNGPTLVICPPAAILQWRNEVLRFTETGALEVRLYYGIGRKTDLAGIMEEARERRIVVLTTYPTMECEYRREVNKTKRQCQWCGRLFVKGKLWYHQKYFCGPDAERTTKQKKTRSKTDAAKKMKIGGIETEIDLNPLNAVRVVSTQARHAVAAGSQEALPASSSSSSPVGMLHPVSVPHGGSWLALDSRRNTLQANMPAEQPSLDDVGTPSPHTSETRKRWRVAEEVRDTGQQNKNGASKSDEPGKSGKGFPQKGCEDAQTSPAPIPCRLSAPRRRRRWALGVLSIKTEEPRSTIHPSSGSWGSKLMRSRRPSPCEGAAIELTQSESERSNSGETTTRPPLEASLSSGASSAAATLHHPTDSASAAVGEPKGHEGGSARPHGPEPDEDSILSPLFQVSWGRIVLDEAHRIKSRHNSTAQAAFALRCSGSRWCLSGTPLQNKVGDFWSIIRFIRFYPYAHYHCCAQGCSCSSLHYRFDENHYCQKCGHAKMQHRSHFSSVVLRPISKCGFVGAGRVAMEKLRSEVLDRILLRRTKLQRQDDVRLPTLEIRVRKDSLSPQEQDFYTSMFTQSRTSFDTFVDKGTLLHNYAHVFDLIMRLRQAVDHPYLIIHGLASTDSPAGLMPSKSRGDADVCALCQDDVEDRGCHAKAHCGHSFHRDCLTEYLDQAPQLPSGGVGCPACFLPVTWAEQDPDAEEADQDDIVADVSGGEEEPIQAEHGATGRKSSIMQKIRTSEFQSSTKIEALVQEIKQMSSEDASSKALVFSQFSRFLELIEWRLKWEGISAAKVMGSTSIVSRNNIIVSFQTEPTLKVLLISLQAGGEGLNLQAANHVFIMDPWWNPAAELQAIQRAHRIGQARPVKATRFVAANTIEEKIMELQQKKQSVFDCTVGNSNEALQRLSAEDIMFLFSASF